MPSKRSLLITFVILLILVPAGVILAQDKSLRWDRFDVNITALPNGDMKIEEIQAITFTSGSFHFGFRSIPLDRVESINNIQVFELKGGRLREYAFSSSQDEYTFDTYQEDGEQKIYWYFPYTDSEHASHTYVIRYLVKGGLRIYDDGDQIWWKAIGPDHNFPVVNSQVTVNLPAEFTEAQISAEAYSTQADIQMPNASTLVFTAGDIPAQQEFEVRVKFPHGVVQAQVPAWQSADDRQRAMKNTYGPVFDLGFLFLGLALFFGGPLAVYALWYTKGRDAPAGIVADTLSEPPSDLTPGLAGTLIDEKADMEDILATLIDLARRGALHIEEKNNPGFLGIGSGREHIFHLKDASVAVEPYEKTLINEVFDSRDTTKLSDLRNSFYTVVPKLQKQLYEAAIKADFFAQDPQKIRKRYMGLGVAGLILSVLFGCGLLILTANFSGMAICPTISLVISSFALIVVGNYMPKKTRLGAEEAAKWQAFKRYLKNIEEYGNLEEAKEKFEQYLPYAIAFGIERSLLRQFSKVDTPPPVWYGPVFVGGMPHAPYGGNFGGGPSSAGSGHPSPGPLAGEGASPSLSDMSRGMGASLQSMSVGLSSMLSSASSAFTSRPSSSGGSSFGGGGGFSGGGSFGGGGGGGGSSGFG